ncbi:transposase [Staphylococcus aureus]|nr:transposase [Staphylococcus aureus]MBM9749159.1 transposase [Staphylococcus aureus]MBM9825448.1 transposase [Staphylococcus aureus]MRM40247.1 transposase [Staphylococcus aureus]MRM74826.1 transposase [Staphylococcus aureus]
MGVGDFILTRDRRTYIKDFKLQMVKLYENGKSRYEIIREYDLTLSIFSN